MNQPPLENVVIRRVTTQTMAHDLGAKILDLPLPVAEFVPIEIALGNVDFFVAESADTPDLRGQVGIDWTAPRTEPVRAALEGLNLIGPGEILPGVAFAEVSEPHRGRAVGRKLLHAVHRLARQREYGRVFLLVDVDNEGAQRLYRGLGYMSTGIVLDVEAFNRGPNNQFRDTPDLEDSEVFIMDL